MGQILVCLNGHRWEPSKDTRPSPQQRQEVCPVCGAEVGVFSLHGTSLSEAASASVEGEPEDAADEQSFGNDAAPGDSFPPQFPAIDGYEIEEQIGLGGMGVVYKARQLSVNRLVALKIIDDVLPQGSAKLARFSIESQVLARLDHPGIVQIFDAGDHQGRPYLALEYVPGGDLRRRLAGRPIPPSDAANLVRQLAEAISAAHKKGIIHRDLKPANVLLSGGVDDPVERCTPKITDFHLAKRLDADGLQTKTGAILGTPGYMAPEQLNGNERDVTPLVDVYALGVLLYELLTGHPPFSAATIMQAIEQVRNNEPTPPSREQSRIPLDLEIICLQAMAKDPGRRYATAERMADDLQRFLDGRPIHARRISTVERLWRWARRNRAVATLAAGTAVSLMAVALVATISAVAYRRIATQAESDSHAAVTARGEAEASRAETEQARRDTQTALADSYTAQGLAASEKGDATLALLYFAHAAQAAPKESERRRLNRIRFGTWLNEVRRPTRVFDLEEHLPEQTEVADTKNLRVIPLPVEAWSQQLLTEINELWPTLAAPGNVPETPSRRASQNMFSDLELRKDGKQILVKTNAKGGPRARWSLFDFDSAKFVDFPGSGKTVNSATWNSDGELLAVGHDNGRVQILRCADGECVQELTHVGRITSLEFSADGRFLAIAGDGVRVWDCQKATFSTKSLPTYDVLFKGGGVTRLVFNSTARRLAAVTRSAQIFVFDISDGSTVTPLFNPARWFLLPEAVRVTGRSGLPVRPQFIDGDRGLVTLEDNWTAFVWCDAETGTPVRSLRIPSEKRLEPGAKMIVEQSFWPTFAVSPDGKFLMVSEGRHAQIWDIASGQMTGPVLTHDSTITTATFTADSQMLLVGQVSGQVSAWSVPEGRLVKPIVFKTTGSVQKVVFVGEESIPATLDENGLIQIWSKPSKTRFERRVPNGFSSRLAHVHLGKEKLIVAGDEEKGLTAVRAHDVARDETGPRIVADSPILDTAISSDGSRIAIVAGEGTLRNGRVAHPTAATVSAWSSGDGRKKWGPVHLPESTVPVAVAYTPDGGGLAVACLRGRVFFLDGETGNVRARKHVAEVSSVVEGFKRATIVPTPSAKVRISPDGREIAIWGYDLLCIQPPKVAQYFHLVGLWNVETNEMRYLPLSNQRCMDARFSEDGRHLATARQDGVVQVWNVAQGSLESELIHPATVNNVRFAPQGEFFLTACHDGFARLWNWRVGELVCPPLAHRDAVGDACFTPDGKWIITVGYDRTARIWEWATGKPLAPPLRLSGIGNSVDVTPDGKFAVVSGYTEATHVFHLEALGISQSETVTQHVDDQGLVSLAETISSRALHAGGGGVVNVPYSDWLKQWRACRDRYRDVLFPAPAQLGGEAIRSK